MIFLNRFSGFNAGGGVSVPDFMSLSAIALSLRKITVGYYGPAIRVRRSSDNAEIDIGFVRENLDTQSLLAFVGAGDGYITTWYDQSANSFDFSQGTASNQPQIVASGAVLTSGGLPTVEFNGSAHYMTSTSGVSVFNNVPYAGVFLVFESDSIATAQKRIFTALNNAGTGSRVSIDVGQTANRLRLGGRRLDADSFASITSSTDHGLAQNQASSLIDYANSDAALYQNGSSVATDTTFQTDGNTSATDSSEVTLGASTGGTVLFDGGIQEMIVFDTDISADRSSIESYQKNYWGTP